MNSWNDYRKALDKLRFTLEQKEVLARAAAHAAEQSAPRRRNFRVALVAAALCLLMVITAAAYHICVNLGVEHDGKRHYEYALLGERPKEAPVTIEEVRMPLTVAEELGLGLEMSYTRQLDGVVFTFWTGCNPSTEEMFFLYLHQYTFESFDETEFNHWQADDKLESESIQLGDRQVTLLHSNSPVPELLWSDGEYCYKLNPSCAFSSTVLEALVSGMQTVENYEVLAAAYPYYRAGSGELKTLQIPGFLPKGIGSFRWQTDSLPYVFWWGLKTTEGYGMEFQQTAYDVELASGAALTYSYLTQHQYDLEIEGMTVEVHTADTLRDYVWYMEDSWCFLRFDAEVAPLLTESFDQTAIDMICSLSEIPTEEAASELEAIRDA